MASASPIFIDAAVEGPVDEAVVRRLTVEADAVLARVHGLRGKDHIKNQMDGFNQAARLSPWFVVVDLDRDAECAPVLVSSWLSSPGPRMCFRVAVRTIEAWLLADRARLADFLKIPTAKIPTNPDRENNPKQKMLQLARRSSNKSIRQALTEGSGGVGRGYTAHMIEFATNHWLPEEAAKHSDSLCRCRLRLGELVRSGP